MDVVQGVNTEEQLELLQLVKANNREKKVIHTIIVGNKFDDPDDAEKGTMVEEAREKAAELFGDGCRAEGLTKMLNDAREDRGISGVVHTFVPMSALHAFMYRKASRMTMDEFGSLDEAVVDKIGHEEVGRRWKRLTSEEKFQVIYDVVSDKEEYKERIAATNFHCFSAVLAHILGGQAQQQYLIKCQMEIELSLLAQKDGCLADHVHSIHKKATSWNIEIVDIFEKFWTAYSACEDECFESLQRNPDAETVVAPFEQLKKFYKLCKLLSWEAEATETRGAMKNFIKRFYSVVIKFAEAWDYETWFNKAFATVPPLTVQSCSGTANHISGCQSPDCWKNGWRKDPHTGSMKSCKFISPKNSWKIISPMDWRVILSSGLLAAQLPACLEAFGIQKAELERQLYFFNSFEPRKYEDHDLQGWAKSVQTRKEHMLIRVLKEGLEDERNAIKRLKMPESPRDPSHWGHIAWEYGMLFHRVDTCE